MPSFSNSNDISDANQDTTTYRATGSSDASLTWSSSSLPDSQSKASEEELVLWIIPSNVQRYALDAFQQVQGFCQETHQNFVLDRKAIATMILIVLASIVAGCIFTALGAGALALVTSPLWVPIALVMSPIWIPFTVLLSPIWMTASVTVLAGGFCACSTVLMVLFFFSWPVEWLPNRTQYSLVDGYLCQRDAATLWLAKLQAKFWLYAAGVGPAADTVFVVLERVDVSAVVAKVQTVNWPELGQKLQKMEFQQIQETLIDIVSSLVPSS